MGDDIWGGFIAPDPALAGMDDPAQALGVKIYSGYQAVHQHRQAFTGRNALFDDIVRAASAVRMPYEDQCSASYYFDIFKLARDYCGEIDRVVEVGVFMGGISTIFAGCMERFRFGLDLVDINPRFLRFAHERIRRTHGQADVRLFYGDLPTYVKNVLLGEAVKRVLVHHDGAHDFNQVVKDLAALSFVRDKVHAIALQDTNLRGRIGYFNFVDAAVYAVFGEGMAYIPIGAVYDQSHTHMVEPNPYQGNYFLPGLPEGMVLPLAHNTFRYPHPSMTLEEFLPTRPA